MSANSGDLIAQRLEWLFQNITKGGVPYTHQEVEEATRQLESGTTVAATTISKIRTGLTKNPGYNTILALAQFFKVPLTFFSDSSLTEEDLDLFRANAWMRNDSELQEIALRAAPLDVGKRKLVLELLKVLNGGRETDTD